MIHNSALLAENALVVRAGAGLGWQFGVVAFFGAVTGLAELTTRYRDNPRRLFKLYSSWAYLIGNAIVAAAALAVATLLNWTFGADSVHTLQCLRLLAAGFGGMLLLRSALVTVRQDGRDISIGPGGVIAAILSELDRNIDRHQAEHRSKAVKTIMSGISFALAKDVLVPYTIRLMESVTAEDTKKVSADAVAVASEPGTDQAKAYALGVIMIQLAGAEVLQAAVDTLREEMRESPSETPPLGAAAAAATTPDLSKYLLEGETVHASDTSDFL